MRVERNCWLRRGWANNECIGNKEWHTVVVVILGCPQIEMIALSRGQPRAGHMRAIAAERRNGHYEVVCSCGQYANNNHTAISLGALRSSYRQQHVHRERSHLGAAQWAPHRLM